jgi:hypothetical protein
MQMPIWPKESQNFWIGYTNIHKHYTLGADEQDYTDTAGYAEQFIRQVARLRDKMNRS